MVTSMTSEELTAIPKGVIETLSRGESALHGGKHISPEVLPSREAAMANFISGQGAEAENAELKAKIAELEAQLAKGAKKEEEPEFSEAELNGESTEDELDDRSLKDLKALAAVRGIKVEGNKKAVVAALAKKEGE